MTLVFTLALGAQVPVFSPPSERPERPEPSEQPPGPETAAPTVVQEDPADPLPNLLERLRAWPATSAKKAGLVLAGLGVRARTPLIAGLSDHDWRIQSGSAYALAEMGDPAAFEPLRLAMQVKSNSASLPEFMRAIVRIDPSTGPEHVLPFLAHSSARVRVAARQALPETLHPRYLPEILALWRSQRTGVRAASMELLARVQGVGDRDEFFDALADPEPQVAYPAARHLARAGTPAARTRLLELAESAPVRQANYALLALVLMEDEQQAAIIPDDGPIMLRARKFLASDDPFYAGTAAIVLANLSYRSDDSTLRELADTYLCPVLIGTVAGGIFFSDYTSVAELCWRKLALLAGVDFGANAMAWKQWWSGSRATFVARRELRSVNAKDLAKARIRYVRTQPDGRVTQIVLSGIATELADRRSGAPLVLDQKEREGLAELIGSCRLFETRGDRPDPSRLDGAVELELRIPESSMAFRRLHYGPTPEALRPLLDHVEHLRRELAWQHFVPASVDDPMAFLEQERAWFDGEPDPMKRVERRLDLAVGAWPALRAPERALALDVISAAPRSWITVHRDALVGLLRREADLTDEAEGLIGVLASESDQKVQSAVLALVSVNDDSRAERVLRSYLDCQPLDGLKILMRDDRANVRAVAAESLSRFSKEPAVVDILIQGLKDYEPRVQDACLKSLSTLDDDRILAMLEAVIQSPDQPQLRLRAIEALGMVGREQVVVRLMDLYREGDRHVKWAVIRALGRAQGRRAVVALSGIVRSAGELDLRREALEHLVRLGGTDVAERLEDILQRTNEPDVIMMTMEGLASVMGARATTTIERFVDHEDATIRRLAVLTLARLGEPKAIPGLLAFMAGNPEGDMAAEQAFQGLTFYVSDNASPPRRSQEYEVWYEIHGAETRLQWFLQAAQPGVDALEQDVDWLTGNAFTDVQLETLVDLLVKGNAPLRQAVDAVLSRVSGLGLDAVGRSDVEAIERARDYRRWLLTK
jgi:HEAT repeat protein